MKFKEFINKVDLLFERQNPSDDNCYIDDEGEYCCKRGECKITYNPKRNKYSIEGVITIGSYGVKDLESEFQKMYDEFGEFW